MQPLMSFKGEAARPSYQLALSKQHSRGIAGFGPLIGRHGTSAAAEAAGEQLKKAGLFMNGKLLFWGGGCASKGC